MTRPPPFNLERSNGAYDERRNEMRLNVVISRVLIAGLASAVALLVVGAILAAVRPSVPVLHESSIIGIPGALMALEPGGFFDLGLIVLLATPAARVFALLIVFAHRRSWLFAGLSVVVLAVLALSAFLGLRI